MITKQSTLDVVAEILIANASKDPYFFLELQKTLNRKEWTLIFDLNSNSGVFLRIEPYESKGSDLFSTRGGINK